MVMLVEQTTKEAHNYYKDVDFIKLQECKLVRVPIPSASELNFPAGGFKLTKTFTMSQVNHMVFYSQSGVCDFASLSLYILYNTSPNLAHF